MAGKICYHKRQGRQVLFQPQSWEWGSHPDKSGLQGQVRLHERH